MNSLHNLRTRTQLERLKQIMKEKEIAMSKTPWWKKIAKALFGVVVQIAVEEVGKKLEDKKDPYPKQK